MSQNGRDINTVLEFNNRREKNEVRSSLSKILTNANKQTVYSKRSPVIQQKSTAIELQLKSKENEILKNLKTLYNDHAIKITNYKQ